jgi:molybdopterin-guanine dinucleotide biosynthesis protein A
MGRDKALLPVVEGGQPMLALVLERISAVADDVLIVASERERYAAFGARVVPDMYPGGGPLVGIHAAVSYAKHWHCLVVACDMPFLSPALLERMAREERDYDVLIPLLRGESRQGQAGLVYQTLHAIYGKGCLAAIETRLDDDKRQVVGFFDDVAVRVIAACELARWDPEFRSFFNANTPEALAAATRVVRSELGSGP